MSARRNSSFSRKVFRVGHDPDFAAVAAGLLPLGNGHLLDEVLLGAVVGLPAGLQVVAELLELGAVFAG